MTFGNRKFTGLLGAATVVIVAQYAFVLSNSVIAGRCLGEMALGALCLLMPLFTLVTFCAGLLALGTSAVCAEAVGSLQRPQANRLAGQGLVASGALGLMLAVLLSLGGGDYCAFMTSDASTRTMAADYLRWYAVAAALECVETLLLYLAYSNGGERCCLFAFAVQFLAGVALSYGLGDGLWGLPALGMSGIALGTVLSCILGLALLMPVLLLRRTNRMRFDFAFQPGELLRSLRIGFWDAGTGLMRALLFLVVVKYIIVTWGIDTLPVAAVVFFVVRLTVFFNGVGIALRPLDTAYRSEGNEQAASRLTHFASLVAVSESLILSGIVLIAPEILVSFLGIRDPELVVAAMRAARLTVLGLSGYALVYLLNSHDRSRGRIARSVFLIALSFFVLPAVLLLTLGSVIGMDGVWLALSLGPFCVLVSVLPFRRRAKTSQPAFMWTLDVFDAAALMPFVATVGARVRTVGAEAVAGRLTDTLALALKRLAEHRGPTAARQAEVSVLFGDEAVVLVLRDDGGNLALDDLGMPVTHVPTAGFNRNVFRFPLVREKGSILAKRQKSMRYAVVRGKDVPLGDIEKVIQLDRQTLDDRYQVSAEADSALFRLNYENGLVVKEVSTGSVVGYSMLVPVRTDVYDLIRTGRFVDTALTPDMLVAYDKPGVYRLYFASVVVHPEHRSASLVLTMLDAMVEDFIALAGRGIFIEKMIADVVSRDGEKFCRLFGLSEVCASNHDSHIYEVQALPPGFRVTTPATERLSGLYWDYFTKRTP